MSNNKALEGALAEINAIFTKHGCKATNDFYRDLENHVFQNLSGDGNKELRQLIMNRITGEKRPVAKCGINALNAELKEHVKRKQNEPLNPPKKATAKPKQAEESKEAPKDKMPIPGPDKCPEFVGKPVVRKACQRAGVVKSYENGKFTVELDDGSIRKPNAPRFFKLYMYENK